MKVYIENLVMIRFLNNPKNCDLDLELVWSIDHTKIDQKNIGYNRVLKSIFSDLNFKIEGVLKLDDFEEFREETSSQIIVNNSFDVLMKMFSLTLSSSHTLSDDKSGVNLGSENVHSALYN